MVSTVITEYKWLPGVVGKMYLDNIDYDGLIFWYDQVADTIKRMKENIKTE